MPAVPQPPPAAVNVNANVNANVNKWAVLAIVAIGVFMATLDSSIVNISLPAIARYFHQAIGAAVEWVVIAYLVVIASLLLTVGRLADLFGRKRIWIAGLAVFTTASLLCGAAPSLGALVASRALQGIGGALLMAISPAMLTAAFPPTERGRAIGMNAVVVALGVSTGPTLGGIITDHLTWRWIFFVNAPLGAAGIVATAKVLREPRAAGARGRFDPVGAVLLALGLAGLTGGLSLGQERGWRAPETIGALVVAAVAIVAFIPYERRRAHPIVDLTLFRNRVFASATASLVISFLAMFAVSFLMPFYLEQLHGFRTEEAGLLLTPLPLTIAVLAPISGATADRIGTRGLAATGMSIACVGLLLLADLDRTSTKLDIVWRLAFAGVGQAIFQSPNNSALLGAAPRERQGIASGMLATARVVGQSLSVAVAGAVFGTMGGAEAARTLARTHGAAPNADALRATFEASHRAAFHVCAAIAAVGVVASLVRGRERR